MIWGGKAKISMVCKHFSFTQAEKKPNTTPREVPTISNSSRPSFSTAARRSAKPSSTSTSKETGNVIWLVEGWGCIIRGREEARGRKRSEPHNTHIEKRERGREKREERGSSRFPRHFRRSKKSVLVVVDLKPPANSCGGFLFMRERSGVLVQFFGV